jgi:hypothetical protein
MGDVKRHFCESFPDRYYCHHGNFVYTRDYSTMFHIDEIRFRINAVTKNFVAGKLKLWIYPNNKYNCPKFLLKTINIVVNEKPKYIRYIPDVKIGSYRYFYMESSGSKKILYHFTIEGYRLVIE